MSCIKRKPCDYSCPVCGKDLDSFIEWDGIDDFDTEFTQWGFCTCECGAKVVFQDVYEVKKTNVVVEE